MDNKGELAISQAYNIQKTKKNVEVVEIITSRYTSLRCTPEHLILTKNKGWVKAENLKPKDKLVGLNRRMRNERSCEVGLSGTKYKHEARFIASHFENIEEKDIHHRDNNPLHNVTSNLQAIPHNLHSQISNQGHSDWNERDKKGQYVTKNIKKKKKQFETGNKKGVNWFVVDVKKIKETADVFDLTVYKHHNCIANSIVVHNCGEVPLPEWTCCNLGAINLSKFVTRDGSFNTKKYEDVIRLGIRTLKNINAVGWYPFPEMNKQMKLLDPCGLGFFGFADALIKLGIYYDSPQALDFIDEICKPYVRITDERAKGSFYKRSQQPTGSLSIIADCSAGIEPVFERQVERHLTIGVISEIRKLYESKYCQTAHEISPESHLEIQARFQNYIDAGISKTINLPSNVSIDNVRNIYYSAWKKQCKGITVFRDGIKDGVLRKKKCDSEECYL